VHPLQTLFGNSYFWHELVHMYLAGYIVTGFLVAAAYAVGRLQTGCRSRRGSTARSWWQGRSRSSR
jgi:cytochrome bd-type quinol oxidase subunit 1